MFKKSFAEIYDDLKSGQGVFASVFGDVIDESELVRITDYINAINNGYDRDKAFSAFLGDVSDEAQRLAREIEAGTVSLDDLSVTTLKSRSAMNSIKKVLSGIGAMFLNMGASAAFFAAIQGALWIIDKMITTTKEYEDATEEAFAKYDEAKQKVKSVNSELQTTKERIDELLRKKSLTFVEQAELDNLREATDLLEQQKKIMEWNEQEAAKKAVKAQADEYKKKYGGYRDISIKLVNSLGFWNTPDICHFAIKLAFYSGRVFYTYSRLLFLLDWQVWCISSYALLRDPLYCNSG